MSETTLTPDTAPESATSHMMHGGHDEPTGLWSWITTVDHKRIGIMYFLTSLIFLGIGGIEAMIIRVQLFNAEQALIGAETYNQLFTMHGTTMIFLVAMPMAVAFFNYVVPLQIGARDVAFPRLNALSYWIYLFGGIYLNSSWFFGAAPNTSWVSYAPLTANQFNPGLNAEFWVIGLSKCSGSSVPALKRFAKHLQQDRPAILAAISTHWSNGQTEGQVNRLKMLKRQMYGRANLDLLRARVLYCVDTT